MNFNIVENGGSNWDKEEDVIRMYKEGVPVADIRKELNIPSKTFNSMLRQFKKDGKIIPRRKPYNFKKKKAKQQPKYWYRNRRGFNVVRKRQYYGYFVTVRQAERFVELMREANWDYSKRLAIKARVMEECQTN